MNSMPVDAAVTAPVRNYPVDRFEAGCHVAQASPDGGECCMPAGPSAAIESGVAEHVRQAVVESSRARDTSRYDPAAADMHVSYQAGTSAVPQDRRRRALAQ
jgi:hypothetical protein